MRQKDLLGRVRRTRKSRLQAEIERHDRESLAARIERARWLRKVLPSGRALMFPTEIYHVFVEAKDTFIDGHFVSTLLLACAFFEHSLSSLLEAHGHEKQARAGLKAIIEGLRKHRLADEYLLTVVDRLRERRNPFVHLKEFDHPHKLDRRWLQTMRDPFELLEADAKAALTIMYQLALWKGVKPPPDGYGLRSNRVLL